MSATRAWALVPVRPFAGAKSRLAPVLSPEERAELARRMLTDVLRALAASPDIAGIALLGNEPSLSALPEAAGVRHFPEQPGEDYREGLARAAVALEASGARSLLVLPGDLPTLTAENVGVLLAADAAAGREAPGRARLTLATAEQDGGSNALVLTPPTALPLLFGPDSAQAHAAEAAARGLAVRQMVTPGFSRDIDTPQDLAWLLAQRVACATLVWMKTRAIAGRLKDLR